MAVDEGHITFNINAGSSSSHGGESNPNYVPVLLAVAALALSAVSLSLIALRDASSRAVVRRSS